MQQRQSAAQPPSPSRILRGHTTPVNAVCAVTPSLVASGSADGIAKLWDLRTAREKCSLTAHSKAGILHTLTLDDHRVITHGRDGFLRLWDVDTLSSDSKPVYEWFCGSYTFTKVATMRWRDSDVVTPFDNVIVSPSAEEKDIVLYDPRVDPSKPSMFIHLDGKDKQRGMCMSLSLFTPLGSSVSTAMASTPFIAAGWEGGQLTLLDLRAGGKLAAQAQVATGTNPLLAFDVSKDGRSVMCGSSAEELSSVEIDYASLTTTVTPFFKCNHGGINFIRIRSDQRIFATAGWDHRVRVFHTRKLKPLAILKHHTESVFSVDFTPDSSLLVSASKDHKLALWSIYPPTGSAGQDVLKPWTATT